MTTINTNPQRQKCNRCKVNLTIDKFKVKRCGNTQKQCIRCNEYCNKHQAATCEHGRVKSVCRDCGTGYCEHGIQRKGCKDCGTGFCEHGRVKDMCRDCGIGYCEHGNRWNLCRECENGYCEHGRRKDRCKDCGTGYCEHDKLIHACKICDPIGYLKGNVCSNVRRALGSEKSKGSIGYLGCDIKIFKKHIEDQFLEGMNWDNHGKGKGNWNIDHIVPIKFEDPTLEEVTERLHWTNTQPLWAIDNYAKGNRFSG